MRAFISFDKRLCRLQFRAPFVDAVLRGTRKIGAVIPGKAGCVVVFSRGRGANKRGMTGTLFMYRISVDESRGDSVGSCLRDARNAANCLYMIRE